MMLRDAVGERRLRLVDRAYGGASRRVLRRIGLDEGQRVVELGCGAGHMTCWLADQVGASGRVVAVDISREQLEHARRRCAERPWVDFVAADARDTGLAQGSFDVAFVRLLLMHLPEPERALEHCFELLRPGGVLLCEELVVSSSFCYPAQEAQADLHRMASAMAAARGCDFDVGRRLHELLPAVGFAEVQAGAHQPTASTGESKHIESLSFSETLRLISDPSEAERARAICSALSDAANDPQVVYGQSRMVQAWGRRPTSPTGPTS